MLQPKVVNFQTGKYAKKAMAHIFKNPVTYSFNLILISLFSGMMTYLPVKVSNVIEYFVGILIFFTYVELTISSTQQKYTLKRLFMSWVLSLAAFKQVFTLFTKRPSFVVGIVFCLIIAVTSTRNILPETVSFMDRLVFWGSSEAIYSFAVMSVWLGFSLSDAYIVSRTLGKFGDECIPVCEQSKNMNKKSYIKMYVELFFVTMLGLLLPMGQIIILVYSVMIAFYSMDIFEIDTSKREKQEQEQENSLKNTVPAL